MRNRRSDAESKEVSAIVQLLDDCAEQTNPIRQKFKESFDMFVNGSQFRDKQDWQVNFSINKFQSSIRVAQGELMATLVNQPDWWQLKPRSSRNSRAEMLRRPLAAITGYYIKASNFKRHAGDFILNSLISMGNLYIGWKEELVQNPRYVLMKTEEERRKAQAKLAKYVENPQETDEPTGDELEESLTGAMDALVALATGEEEPETPQEKIKPYIQIGKLDFQDPNPERVYWDPNVAYMEDSAWKAFEYEVHLHELYQAAKFGAFSKSKVDDIPSQMPRESEAYFNLRYKATLPQQTNRPFNKVLLTLYMGPLIIGNEVKKDRVFYLIANRSKILKKIEYPFWEPPGHKTAIINAAVKRIPGRPTGAGIGDSAIAIQKVYDSNWQLICDTFRFGIAGINIVDYQQLVDKSALKEGIEPGKTIQVRGDPKKVFHREQLTANLENQVSPVQETLRLAIDDLIGLNSMFSGAPNLRSRTTAKETEAQLQGAQRTVNTIALDLEENFIKPALEKIFARVLQFGLSEAQNNPELRQLLSEAELKEIMALNDADKMEILQTFYEFEIKGFSARQDRDDKLARMNEVLTIINSGGPLSMLVDLPRFLELWAELMELKDDGLLVMKNSPMDLIAAENTSLMNGHMVIPSPNDDDELHMKLQGPLAMAPYATPEMQQHLAMHQEQMMQKQAMQAEIQAQQEALNAPPEEEAPPPTQTRLRFQETPEGARDILIDEIPVS